MKMKTQLTLAAVVAAGLLASGCSQQMVGQQVAQQVAPAPVAPIVKTVVDCSKCKRPAAPTGGNMHTHPAIPGCTNSVRHNHPHPQGARHSHKYSCKKAPPRRPAPPPRRPAPPPMKAPVMPQVNPNTHTHPAIPNCTNSVRHTHPNGNRPHSHRYSCRKPAVQRPVQRPVYRPVQQRPVYRPPVVPVPKMPQVKAKGTYRGPIQIDGVMQQYQN